jgi:hypothetical protein
VEALAIDDRNPGRPRDGRARIWVKIDGIPRDFRISLTVTDGVVDATEVRVSPGARNIRIYDGFQLRYMVFPARATTQQLTWSSSNESFVKVSQGGYAWGVGESTAYVTATAAGNVKSDPVAVTVRGSNPVMYTLEYDGNGDGDIVTRIPPDRTVRYPFRVSVRSGLGMERAGHIFVGWNTVANPSASNPGVWYGGVGTNFNREISLTSDITLFAIWAPYAIFGNFSDGIPTPTQPQHVTDALETINLEHNVWPAGTISNYHGWTDFARAAALTGIESLALATVAGGYLTLRLDAAALMGHFLGNTGTPRIIDFKRMNNDAPEANENRRIDINEALAAAEHLAQTGRTVTFSSIDANVVDGDEVGRWVTSGNWFYAIGGYNTKIRCTVTKSGSQYTATIDYFMWDVYDWDRELGNMGNLPVSQRDMWELQYGGRAKGFLVTGVNRLRITWTEGQRMGTGARVIDRN